MRSALFFVLLAAAAASETILKGRIVGGESVDRNKWPFLVRFKRHGCGASIIGHHWIVTAAHCVLFDKTVSDGELFIINIYLLTIEVKNLTLIANDTSPYVTGLFLLMFLKF